jgi:hypothetical protein
VFRFIAENYYKEKIPRWMLGTRFEKLYLLDRWLDCSFYDEMPLSFNQEKSGGSYNPLHTRRPSVQLNFPNFIADLTACKLFAGRHVPRLKHENEDFLLKVQALVEELRLPVKMMEAIKRGSVGSVLILFKMLKSGENVRGVVNVKQSQYCTPTFNEFEDLIGVMEHYLCTGASLLTNQPEPITRDRDGDPVKADRRYWYVKIIDTNGECVYYPLKEHDWNPVNAGKYRDASTALVPYPMTNNPFMHNLGFVQGVWIKNLTGGNHPEGKSTWEPALNNFIELDYLKSQNGRGLKYSSAPQLVIKGDFRAEVEGDELKNPPRDAGYLLRLAADTKDQMGTDSSGHDAFLLETNGNASKASDDYVNSLKHVSFEGLRTARKDLESIKGTMTGKVIELIDEDFLDLLQEMRLTYCSYGYLPLVKKLCKAAAAAGHQLMAGVKDALIDGLVIDFPPSYLPDAQDIQFLVSAFVEATADQQDGPAGPDGKKTKVAKEPLIDINLAKPLLAKLLDLVEESLDRPQLPDTKVDVTTSLEPEIEPVVSTGEDGHNLVSGFATNLAVDEHNRPLT